MVDPRFLHPLGPLGMVDSVKGRRFGRGVDVTIAVPPGHTGRDALVREVSDAASRAAGGPADVTVRMMEDAEVSALRARLLELGRPASAASGAKGAGGVEVGTVKGPGRVNPFMEKASTTRVLGISSGKGGVGKSSVTVNLAVAMARLGHSVGLLDADVYGFSVPKMLGATDEPIVVDGLLVPPVAYGVRCMSMGFVVEDDQPVVWRGPLLHKALEQFLVDVHWGRPDFLIVDMPPGTGDVALSMAQYLPRAELFVVTTPQAAAERVAQRSAIMGRQLKLPVRGVIENMSYFTGDDGKRYELFGSGGGESLASTLGVALLARIPFVPAVREGGDTGKPVAAADPESEAGAAFGRLAEAIVGMGPARVYRSELSVR
ncbi:MAG TPA: Mrp/NBP35 family ATP-binding protein [Acidimicrobiales bacterium]|nr:Mrp/NBP35 family ATP-binding protein [Acidimicrobiales bacterium]